MSDYYYHTPQGSYAYGKTYVSRINPYQTWTPINPSKLDPHGPPPDPSTYMFGAQYGDCFVHPSDRGIVEKIFRWIFCLG
jgi:hypothetical protein